VVFVSGHLGNWEITAGTVAHRNTPLTVVYSPNRNPSSNVAFIATGRRFGAA
jgi:lauroyl/myristoyl acyltransferase